jgi:hypothetical protein
MSPCGAQRPRAHSSRSWPSRKLPAHLLVGTMLSPAGQLLKPPRQLSRMQLPQSLPLVLGMTTQTMMTKVCTPVAVEIPYRLHVMKGRTQAVDWRAWSHNVKVICLGLHAEGADPTAGMNARQKKLYLIQQKLRQSRKANQQAVVAEKRREVCPCLHPAQVPPCVRGSAHLMCTAPVDLEAA